jgi:hypothetical protein
MNEKFWKRNLNVFVAESPNKVWKNDRRRNALI